MKANIESNGCFTINMDEMTYVIENYCSYAQTIFGEVYDGCIATKRNGRTLRWLEKRCKKLLKIKDDNDEGRSI